MEMIYEYYLKLTRKQKKKFIQSCCNLCDFSYQTFMYKMRKQTWTKLEKEAIERFIKTLKQDVNPS